MTFCPFPERLRSEPTMYTTSVNDYLRQHIRTVPDWPAPGVQFRDITPLLQNPQVFRILIDAFVHRYMSPEMRPDVVAGSMRAALSWAPSSPMN